MQTQKHEPFLQKLNHNQRDAVMAPIDGFVEIVAGPGTGKTTVLTSRVAYLLLNSTIKPEQLIVTTFTRKAAKEMKERLAKLLQNNPEIKLSKLRIGTFHSLCLLYLKYYGHLIGLKNFKIASDSDQKDIFNSIKHPLDTTKITLGSFKTFMAKQKAFGFFPDDVKDIEVDELPLQEMYTEYQAKLKDLNLIDLDDILIYTRDLLIENPHLVSYIKHVLVDEFQDTNVIQLELIKAFASHTKNNITIVGDSDQSIYGFRHANYENYKLIESSIIENHGKINKFYLDQNYRSTNNILQLAEFIMRNQSDRDDKTLYSNHGDNHIIHLQHFEKKEDEAKFIVSEILSLCDNSGKYNFNDFCVIARSTSSFAKIERELNRKFIPYVVLRGSVFWKLKEIIMVLDILKVVSYYDDLSYIRLIDTFGKGCGSKFIENLKKCFEKKDDSITFHQLLLNIANNKEFKVNKNQAESIFKITGLIEECKKVLHGGTLSEFIDFSIDSFKVMSVAFNKKSTSTSSPTLEEDIKNNLAEFKSLFLEYNLEEDQELEETQKEIFENQHDIKIVNDSLDDTTNEIFLSHFITYSNISATAVTKDCENIEKGKVTLSTIHSSKGLEWPIVFVPAVMDNKIPSSHALRAEDPERTKFINEERRCLYVALTRAKDQLYLSTYFEENAPLSMFLRSVPGNLITVKGSRIQEYNKYSFNSFKHINKQFAKFQDSKAFYSTQINENKTKNENQIRDNGIVLESKNIAKPVVGCNGAVYNPVTGALLNTGNVGKIFKKKKRLGMGKSLKSILGNLKKR